MAEHIETADEAHRDERDGRGKEKRGGRDHPTQRRSFIEDCEALASETPKRGLSEVVGRGDQLSPRPADRRAGSLLGTSRHVEAEHGKPSGKQATLTAHPMTRQLLWR